MHEGQSRKLLRGIYLKTSERMDQRFYKKDKYIPVYGQNVLALSPQPGMEYAIEWLKYEKLHKYWPMISRLSYYQLLALDEHNWLRTLQTVGIREDTVTEGAKKKLLRLTADLRRRAVSLKHALLHGDIYIVVDKLREILRTPLAHQPELDGQYLIPLIRQAMLHVCSTTGNRRIIRKHPVMLNDYFSMIMHQ